MTEPLPPAILWIDGVGGFLVLRGDAITLGPAFADPPPDVAILADLSRNHATIRRDGEGYSFHAQKPASVNLTAVGESLLKSDDRITLGASCQLVFRRPQPLCASARLDLVSGHRFGHPVDAVLLMADALTLDRSPHAQIQMGIHDRVVIFRQGNDLAIKASATIRANGQPPATRAILNPGVPTTVEDVTLTLELLS